MIKCTQFLEELRFFLKLTSKFFSHLLEFVPKSKSRSCLDVLWEWPETSSASSDLILLDGVVIVQEFLDQVDWWALMTAWIWRVLVQNRGTAHSSQQIWRVPGEPNIDLISGVLWHTAGTSSCMDGTVTLRFSGFLWSSGNSNCSSFFMVLAFYSLSTNA